MLPGSVNKGTHKGVAADPNRPAVFLLYHPCNLEGHQRLPQIAMEVSDSDYAPLMLHAGDRTRARVLNATQNHLVVDIILQWKSKPRCRHTANMRGLRRRKQRQKEVPSGHVRHSLRLVITA